MDESLRFADRSSVERLLESIEREISAQQFDSTAQIGSIPYVARCSSMNATITSLGGPPVRNTPTPFFKISCAHRRSKFSRSSCFNRCRFVGCQPGALALVTLGLRDPTPQRLGRAAQRST